MQKIDATLKLPNDKIHEYIEQLKALDICDIEIEVVPYERFVEESRMNYDCVFPQMWTEEKDVAYVKFSFDDTPEGRKEAFRTEYNVMQVPLNLRYRFE